MGPDHQKRLTVRDPQVFCGRVEGDRFLAGASSWHTFSARGVVCVAILVGFGIETRLSLRTGALMCLPIKRFEWSLPDQLESTFEAGHTNEL
jgi:hypothetical protein